MKRQFRLICALLALLLLLPGLVLADGEGGEDVEPTPQEAEPLILDTDYLYPGMDRSIRGGFSPKAEEGFVTFILPIQGSTTGNTIRVLPELAPGGPFEPGEYEVKVSLSQHTVTNDKKEESARKAYLAVIRIPLAKVRYNGTYPICFTVTYTDVNGEPQRQVFTQSFTVTDGRKASFGGGGSRAEKRPLITAAACTVFPTKVRGGDSFSVTITLQNLGDKEARNLRVTFSDEAKEMICTDAINAQYVKSLDTDLTTQLRFHFDTLCSIAAGAHYLACEVTYADKGGTTYTEEATVRVDITQPASIGYDLVRLPESVAGGSMFHQIYCVYNTGYTTLYNVRCELDVDGLISASAYMGNIEPQQDCVKESVVYGTIRSGGEQYGRTDGYVVLHYQDETGAEYVELMDVSTRLTEPVRMTDEEKEKQARELAKQKAFSQWWASLLAGLGIIAILVSVIVTRRVLRELRMR